MKNMSHKTSEVQGLENCLWLTDLYHDLKVN